MFLCQRNKNYLTTLPSPLLSESFSTSSIVVKFKSPGIVCFIADEAIAKLRASSFDFPVISP